MKKINSKNAGFTIVETLVAIFILLISITGPMVFSQSGLRSAFQSRDQITAFYLAQDAIEFVKNRRDHNVLVNDVNRDWLDGLLKDDLDDKLCLINGSPDSTGCTINTTENDGQIKKCNASKKPGCIVSDDPNDDEPLTIDDDGYIISKENGEDSIFYSTVYIKEIESDREAQVVVKIRWTSHDSIGSREITVAENIYNWGDALGI